MHSRGCREFGDSAGSDDAGTGAGTGAGGHLKDSVRYLRVSHLNSASLHYDAQVKQA